MSDWHVDIVGLICRLAMALTLGGYGTRILLRREEKKVNRDRSRGTHNQ